MSLRSFDQFLTDAVGDFSGENCFYLLEQIGRVRPGRKSGNSIADSRFSQAFVTEFSEQRLALRHKLIKFSTLAAQNIGKNFCCGKIRVVESGKAKRDGGETVRRIGIERLQIRLYRQEMIFRSRWKFSRRNTVENDFDFFQRIVRLHVTSNDQ